MPERIGKLIVHTAHNRLLGMEENFAGRRRRRFEEELRKDDGCFAPSVDDRLGENERKCDCMPEV